MISCALKPAFYLPVLLFAAATLPGCFSSESTSVNQPLLDRIEKRKNDPWNVESVDSAVGLLQTGDVVLRTGNDITSHMLCQLNQTNKTYSHCGLVLVENGYPFVYHSIGGESNPNARMRRDSAHRWFAPEHNIGFGVARLDMAGDSPDSLRGIVRKMYREGRKFDMDFDLRTDDRLYCAEFVYKAVNQAVSNEEFLRPINVMGYRFVGIDNIFLSEHAELICEIRFK